VTGRLALAIAELVAALREEAVAERTPNAPERLLRVDEAAAALGIGRSSLYGEIASGRLGSVKVGRLGAHSSRRDRRLHRGPTVRVLERNGAVIADRFWLDYQHSSPCDCELAWAIDWLLVAHPAHAASIERRRLQRSPALTM